jgi:fructosamine-3-kinase
VILQTNIPFTREHADTVLSHWCGHKTNCTAIEKLHGGMCYTVLRLKFSQFPFSAVIKLDAESEDAGFARERIRLEYVLNHTSFPCPEPYCEAGPGIIPFSFLLLQDLPGTVLSSVSLNPQEQHRFEIRLAEILIDLHGHTSEYFGEIDSIGKEKHWKNIFLPRLYELRQDMSSRLGGDVMHTIDSVLTHADRIMSDQGIPTLVHGDIWDGNIIVEQKNDGWHLSGIVDLPALQFADHEYELAYLDTFDTVHDTFYTAYTRVYPLRPDYEIRKLYYQLHTWMLHVWLFDEERYYQRTEETANKLATIFP